MNNDVVIPMQIQHVDNNNNNDKNTVVAVVTVCLAQNHSKCTGTYIDTLTGQNIVICKCSCH